MKILQVSNRVPWPLNEGGTIGIYNFTKAFAEYGHEVHLYCLDGIKHNTPLKEAERELSKYARTYFHPIDTDIKPDEALKNLLGKESYNVSRFDNGAFRQELKELLQKEKFDVVQLEGTFVGPYADTIRELHSGILSLRMHNVEYEIWERLAANAKNPLKAWYLKILAKRLKVYEKELLQKVDVVVPVTQTDADKFKTMASDQNYLVIPAGIDEDYWEFAPSYQWRKWYHLGSMEWMPNQEAVNDYLQNWHPILKNEIKEYSFHLAGKGLDTSNYQDAEQLSVYSVVHDAYTFVRDMDVCIVPLRSGSGIRLKILEAMSAGKLVVSTTIGIQGIDAKDGKHLIIADDPAELKEKLLRLEQGKIEVRSMIDQARALVHQQYSIQACSDRLLAYYKDHLR